MVTKKWLNQLKKIFFLFYFTLIHTYMYTLSCTYTGIYMYTHTYEYACTCHHTYLCKYRAFKRTHLVMNVENPYTLTRFKFEKPEFEFAQMLIVFHLNPQRYSFNIGLFSQLHLFSFLFIFYLFQILKICPQFFVYNIFFFSAYFFNTFWSQRKNVSLSSSAHAQSLSFVMLIFLNGR